MKIPLFITRRVFDFLLRHVADRRSPDFIVGADSIEGAYLLRWYLTPWRRLQSRVRNWAERRPTRGRRAAACAVGLLPNLYLHQFRRDDDDRALHDHPSMAISWLLHTGYIEHTIAAGGIHRRVEYRPGSVRYLPTRHAHRIELLKVRDFVATQPDNLEPISCWSLFLFGPAVREWGFHCPERGWVHWRDFTAAGRPGEIGPGCGA